MPGSRGRAMCIINENVYSSLESGEGVRLNLGCGRRSREGFVGVDRLALPGVDIVADLNMPLVDLPDECVTEIYSRHVLEHVDDLLPLMAELHRVCRPDARIEIVVPHFSNPYYYSDPTHVRHFGLYTFFYFSDEEDQPRRKVPAFYMDQRFTVEDVKIRLLKRSILVRPMANAMEWLINRGIGCLDWYERSACWICPAESIRFVLRPKKVSEAVARQSLAA